MLAIVDNDVWNYVTWVHITVLFMLVYLQYDETDEDVALVTKK